MFSFSDNGEYLDSAQRNMNISLMIAADNRFI
jgi:hypothetical protein